jgi:acetoin:2,6-dichlorophenolindophenol oxidoreductase subunit alpha
MTYRFHGHIFGDADAYMDPERKQAAIAADPVPRFRGWLIEQGHASEADLAAMEAAIDTEIDEAIDYALASDFPDVAELGRDVFAAEAA